MVSTNLEGSEQSFVAVIGASGFIGSWVLGKAKERFGNDRVVGVYFHKKPESSCLAFEEFITEYLPRTHILILVAGNSDHALPHRDFAKAYEIETGYLHRIFERRFLGLAIYLSSAAVYYGSEGAVSESLVYPTKDEYGLTKLLAEHTLRCYARNSGSKVLVYRLMYTYGKGEKPTRLMSRIGRSLQSGEKIGIHGTGKSYINPLPVWFVAEVLVKSVSLVEEQATEFEVINLAHHETVRVIDLVNHMKDKYGLKYELCGTESYPVNFYVDVSRLKRILPRIGMDFPDMWKELDNFVEEWKNA